jgi:hypothetical protein
MTETTKKAAAKKKARPSKQTSMAASKKATQRTAKVTPEIIIRPTPSERTSEEAAELLGLSDGSSVRQLVRRGKLGGRVIGRKLWISLRAIEKYNQTRQSPGRPLDTITGESHNKRGERETEYQREYKRRIRAAAKSGKKGAKRGASKRAAGRGAAKRGG